ncbi:MAG TPA: flagellar biosynthetic protein FliO [Steroidobacteraceae bacterium]|jgi:flagellar protein FliO/FliZ
MKLAARIGSFLPVLIGTAMRALGAEPGTPFAAPMLQAAPSAGGGLLRVTLALLVVLAAVLMAAWLTRRMRGFGNGRALADLQVLAQMPLGTRERAVLLRVGECQLLIGVTPTNVRTLHVLPSPAVPAPNTEGSTPTGAAADLKPTFKSLLLKSLGK